MHAMCMSVACGHDSAAIAQQVSDQEQPATDPSDHFPAMCIINGQIAELGMKHDIHVAADCIKTLSC